MNQPRGFCDVVDAMPLLDRIVSESLAYLHADLPDWYEREQEIVSLFAFGHLVPLMQREHLDPGQLVIEGRMGQVKCKRDAKSHRRKQEFEIRVRRDLVFRNQRHDGCFRVEGKPDQPFAVMEWKLNTANRTPKHIRDEFETDLQWLADNASPMRVGYCVLVEWPRGALNITCARVRGTQVQRDFLVLPAAASTTA